MTLAYCTNNVATLHVFRLEHSFLSCSLQYEHGAQQKVFKKKSLQHNPHVWIQ